MSPKRTSRSLANSTLVIKQRLQYICTVLFDGKYSRFAHAVGYTDLTSFRRVLYKNAAVTPAFLSNIIQHGVVNAEFLMCGSGPVCSPRPDNLLARLEVASHFDSSVSCFDTKTVQFSSPPRARLSKPGFIEPAFVRSMFPAARDIYTARAANKPVFLYLTEEHVLSGASAAIVDMLRKKYVTALICTSGAIYRDLEWARFGGFARTAAFQQELSDLNDAAYLAAAQGLGYGEAIGRWCYSNSKRRDRSVVAAAYDLRVPLFVRVAIGEVPTHWFPAKRTAELGAALGAAAYTDMLSFTEHLRQCAGAPGGAFLTTAAEGASLFHSACAAIHSDKDAAVIDDVAVHSFYRPIVSGELWRTFPALLTACDAVYDGSADDAR